MSCSFIARNEELYLFHEDNDCSYENVEVGDKMYFTAYESNDLVVDGYNGRVGTPNQFQFKFVVDYEFISSHLVEYENECFEVNYGRIIKVHKGGEENGENQG